MTPALGADVRSLLRDAAAWRLIALLLERPRGAWKDEVARLACEVDDAELRAAARLAAAATEGTYLATLGPTGVASPREVSHAGMRDPGQLLAELEACYRAFAYRPRTEDPPDHIAVEAGFVGYLRLKEGFARAEGEAREAEVSDRAGRDFVASHVAPCATALALTLQHGGAPHLRSVVRVLSGRAGPSPAPSGLGHSPIIWPDADSCACAPTSHPATRG